ncbi:hypothetical protein DM01DRAFT_1292994 [Hesseltinella vesiculosa]|uniref:Uncharacterized protein n=1 Tax=Hesseltinella vesiculosa TaxID=101127 RepID=A0A1X2G809_9FUNG|nr:hypothetical protein DM01DRAFT_1292994 [Hesseltinella vesiculosa]
MDVSPDTVRRHLRHFLDLIPRPPHVKKPKARALGSTRAAQTGVPVDDILSQGNWSSRGVFNDFYRLSSSSQTDFTTATLS